MFPVKGSFADFLRKDLEASSAGHGAGLSSDNGVGRVADCPFEGRPDLCTNREQGSFETHPAPVFPPVYEMAKETLVAEHWEHADFINGFGPMYGPSSGTGGSAAPPLTSSRTPSSSPKCTRLGNGAIR